MIQYPHFATPQDEQDMLIHCIAEGIKMCIGVGWEKQMMPITSDLYQRLILHGKLCKYWRYN